MSDPRVIGVSWGYDELVASFVAPAWCGVCGQRLMVPPEFVPDGAEILCLGCAGWAAPQLAQWEAMQRPVQA